MKTMINASMTHDRSEFIYNEMTSGEWKSREAFFLRPSCQDFTLNPPSFSLVLMGLDGEVALPPGVSQ